MVYNEEFTEKEENDREQNFNKIIMEGCKEKQKRKRKVIAMVSTCVR